MIRNFFYKIYRYKRRVVFLIKESEFFSFRKSIIPDEYIIKVKCTPKGKKPIIEKWWGTYGGDNGRSNDTGESVKINLTVSPIFCICISNKRAWPIHGLKSERN